MSVKDSEISFSESLAYVKYSSFISGEIYGYQSSWRVDHSLVYEKIDHQWILADNLPLNFY